jgi:ElaB/YqjD/DUF883 family membrane-anchored ribosome-binding protein
MNPEFTKQFEGIKKEVEILNQKLADMASLSIDELEAYKADTMKQVTETTKDVSEQAAKQAKKIDEYTKENPWIVAAGFAGAGLLIGLLLSNQSSKK